MAMMRVVLTIELLQIRMSFALAFSQHSFVCPTPSSSPRFRTTHLAKILSSPGLHHQALPPLEVTTDREQNVQIRCTKFTRHVTLQHQPQNRPPQPQTPTTQTPTLALIL